jgi:hypothetical protein
MAAGGSMAGRNDCAREFFPRWRLEKWTRCGASSRQIPQSLKTVGPVYFSLHVPRRDDCGGHHPRHHALVIHVCRLHVHRACRNHARENVAWASAWRSARRREASTVSFLAGDSGSHWRASSWARRSLWHSRACLRRNSLASVRPMRLRLPLSGASGRCRSARVPHPRPARDASRSDGRAALRMRLTRGLGT